MFKKMLGFITLVLGVLLLGWIGYNYLIEMQLEAAGRNPVLPLIVSACFIFYGQKWLREEKDR